MFLRYVDPKTRKQLPIVALVLFILAVGIGVGAAIFGGNNSVPVTPAGGTVTYNAVQESIINGASNGDSSGDDYTIEDSNTIFYNGVEYRPNYDITTLLFLGIDSHVSIDPETGEETIIESASSSGNAYGNGGRADTILLFIINDEDNSLNVLEINRDTYMSVDVYDDDRNYIYAGNMQISMQYAFGESATRSCWLMKNKVEELLFGTYIDYYCSLTLDGASQVIDAMNGIEVTFDEDFSYIDPAFTEGTTITMTSEQSESFFRYRDTEELGSNEQRMNHQAWLMRQVFENMATSSTSDIDELYNAAGNYLATDMHIDVMRSIRNYELQNFYTVPGEYVAGEFHDEYHVDDEALQELIIELFYVEV